MDTVVDETPQKSYTVKTQVFEGPLDLLLSLIEERKLFINEISLSLITEDYAKYINEIKDTYTNDKYYEITGYLVVLATLLLIKSRSLLPNFEITQEEKVTIDDLEDKLKIYKAFKDVSKHIEARFGKQSLYTKQPQKKDVVFIPDIAITTETMHTLVKEVLGKTPVVEKIEKNPDVVVKTTITLEEVMERIHQTVDELSSFSFHQFASVKKTYTKEEKVFTVISFLAILELIRTGILFADQENTFGDFNITKNNSEIIYE